MGVACCRYPQAKLDAERAVALRPDWAKANARLAAAYAGLRQLDKAIESYTICAKLAPGDKQYVTALNETRVRAFYTSWTPDEKESLEDAGPVALVL